MPRVPRSSLPDGIYHVYARAVDGERLFRDDDDHRFFLALLEAPARTPKLTLHARCLMPNHYHLVAETTAAALSRAMWRLNARYGEAFNAKYERTGHVFGGRFKVRVVESEAYLENACSYVIHNPVRAGLVERAAEWPWSWSRYGLDV